MDGNDTGSQVVDFDVAEAAPLHQGLERGLVRMHADRFGEVAIRLGGAGDAFAKPRQHAERVQVVERLERPPHLRKLEYDYSAFETKSYQLAGASGGSYTFDAKPRDIQSAVVRLSYKFGGPVVAKY